MIIVALSALPSREQSQIGSLPFPSPFDLPDSCTNSDYSTYALDRRFPPVFPDPLFLLPVRVRTLR